MDEDARTHVDAGDIGAIVTPGLCDLLRAWPIGTVQSVARPGAGTVNQTLLITTSLGRYALRTYRHRDRLPIVREHAIIAHARAHGLPAIGPLPLSSGGAILERDGQFHALFPAAPGRQYARAALAPAAALAMGTCLALLHRALADVPETWAVRRSFTFDTDAVLAGIARLEALIRSRPRHDDGDIAALAWLLGQRSWIARSLPDDRGDLSLLDQQVIHGDYQETNLFFASGRVSAIIDWDQTYVAPRAWEAVRAMHLAFAFSPHLCRPFLAAYRALLPLSLDDLDRAVAAYARKVGHDLWIYEEYYLHGNARVRRFFQPGGFVSPGTQWRRLRPALLA
jgi:homoserine kinase type II